MYSPNHSACSSILVQATNESLCRTANTFYIISWVLIAIAILMTLGQIASLTQSRNSTASTGKFCVSCGKPMTMKSAFCPQCGAAVEGTNHTNVVEIPQESDRRESELSASPQKLVRGELTEKEPSELGVVEDGSHRRRRSMSNRNCIDPRVGCRRGGDQRSPQRHRYQQLNFTAIDPPLGSCIRESPLVVLYYDLWNIGYEACTPSQLRHRDDSARRRRKVESLRRRARDHGIGGTIPMGLRCFDWR